MISKHITGLPRWTEAALKALPKGIGKWEYIGGELVCMAPAGFDHGGVCGRIFLHLAPYVEKNNLGMVVDGQTGFRMKSGDVLSPDVSYISNKRLRAYKHDTEGFFHGSPDLAVEVISPEDRKSKLLDKVAAYFANQTKLVWVVYHRHKTVHVYRSIGRVEILKAGDTLTGESVIPGFKLRVGRMFSSLPQ